MEPSGKLITPTSSSYRSQHSGQAYSKEGLSSRSVYGPGGVLYGNLWVSGNPLESYQTIYSSVLIPMSFSDQVYILKKGLSSRSVHGPGGVLYDNLGVPGKPLESYPGTSSYRKQRSSQVYSNKDFYQGVSTVQAGSFTAIYGSQVRIQVHP